ncbi:hypothetical protein [Gemmata sp.]|uniref:hypothetical protein n=1 Tax=Gemmata sp. TaxID=1914242 RepID=UPI003F6EF93B
MRYALLVVASLALGVVAGRQTARVPEREAAMVPAGPVLVPQPRNQPEQEGVAVAPLPREVPKRTDIPLSSIYCANWRKDGLRVPRRKDDEEFTEQWERLRKRLAKMPYRTAFLVQSATIEGAVSDTLDVVDGRREGSGSLSLSEELGHKSVWAVLFFGNLIGEREVTCTSVTYSSSELTVTVRIGEDRGETVGISVPNLYWVPLIEVQPGGLTLRIHDSETKTDLLVVRTSVE